ncbi:MAG: ABC transporter ATP-binding protein, partial [Turicibacter sp.]|nr:ABC transporter ATP-binding protein [Turicibacter sp.]
MIEVKNISQSYTKGGVKNLDNVSLVVRENAVTALVGANGAGKSTLLGAMSNLVQTLSGEVLLDGVDVRK